MAIRESLLKGERVARRRGHGGEDRGGERGGADKGDFALDIGVVCLEDASPIASAFGGIGFGGDGIVRRRVRVFLCELHLDDLLWVFGVGVRELFAGGGDCAGLAEQSAAGVAIGDGCALFFFGGLCELAAFSGEGEEGRFAAFFFFEGLGVEEEGFEFLVESDHRGRAMFGFFGERSLEEGFDLVAECAVFAFVGECGRDGADVLHDDVVGIVAVEGGFAGEHLVEDDRPRVDIGSLIERAKVSASLFGGHVERCSNAQSCARDGNRRFVHDLGDAEVHELDVIGGAVFFDQKDIFGFEIAVNDLEGMDAIHCGGDLAGDMEDTFTRETILFFDGGFERFAFQEFHCVVIADAFGVSEVGDINDVFVSEFASGEGFAAEAFGGLSVGGELGVEDLDRKIGAEFSVFCAINDAEAAFTFALEEAIIANHASYKGIFVVMRLEVGTAILAEGRFAGICVSADRAVDVFALCGHQKSIRGDAMQRLLSLVSLSEKADLRRKSTA